ncbi:uncharacterized protein SPPG_09521 [Spizellomyces punctatus DAOM BR117]|uniref:Uncharacterized protein n=1 Tax=Spizellomyces punctatus (strain DAOM BR117) TaxID=645134 RepID=A0A0L0H797_SPIPD|nr:uncharacterized protein SPPG_09521 [Spizellomyces punctatus DAOM BR117]KNC96573.1 hypothetical protein SPPG_09521 [Spizellomyces punctatus DAOM BR117]|eukprot:XP_016604613.1 hypothetical protein SPPG_09521 [Spizellomyces punctatus DAOM BR117]
MNRLFTAFTFLALVALTYSAPASDRQSHLVARQSNSNTKCEADPYPNLNGTFRLQNCTVEYDRQLANCDNATSTKDCKDAAKSRRTQCEAICSTTSRAVERCVKSCNRNWKTFDDKICKPITNGTDQESCNDIALSQVSACQDICLEYHKGL